MLDRSDYFFYFVQFLDVLGFPVLLDLLLKCTKLVLRCLSLTCLLQNRRFIEFDGNCNEVSLLVRVDLDLELDLGVAFALLRDDLCSDRLRPFAPLRDPDAYDFVGTLVSADQLPSPNAQLPISTFEWTVLGPRE